MKIKETLFFLFKDRSEKADRIRRYGKLLFVLTLFVVLFSIVPIKDVANALLSADPENVVIGLVIGLLSVILTAAQLEPLTRNQGIQHSIWRILAINLAVKFYVNFFPTTLIASGYRWHRLAQPDNKHVESLAALGYFRVMETFLNLALGIVFFLLAGNHGELQVSIRVLILILIVIILTALAIHRWTPGVYRWFTTTADRHLKKETWKKIAHQVEKILTAVRNFSDMSVFDLSLSFGSGILSAFSGIASGVFLARSVGIDIGFLNMGWIQSVILFATQLPFTVAGGLGVREVTLLAILASFGVSAEQSLALSFLLFFRGAIQGLIGGLIEGSDALKGKKQVDVPTDTSREENIL